MADSDDTPPLGRIQTKRRIQTATERDIESERARRERQASVSGEIEDSIPDEITGRYEGDELEMYRSKRSTDERISHLEKKHDKLLEAHLDLTKSVNGVASSIAQVNTTVSELRGEMKIIPELVGVLKGAAERKDEREKITLTTTLDVNKAQVMDPIKAREARRGWVTAIIAIMMTIATGVMAIVQARGC